MGDFKTIINKLEQFIKKYYINELLRGLILFFTIGLLYFLFTLFVEYMFWLNPGARTILFWCFVLVELTLFIKFILVPVLHLFKLRQGIDYEKASGIIGRHFPEVNDKLLNILQLNHSPVQSDILAAGIEQKSKELKPIPFASAINFKSNLKYLKYAAIPLAIIFTSWVSGKIDWFNESYHRVVNYQTAYEPPAPFQFFVKNTTLQVLEGQEFTLKVTTLGELSPEDVQIQYNGQSYYLQTLDIGDYEYTFRLPKKSIEFILLANGVHSKPYTLDVIKTPNLINLEMLLDYPAYTKKEDEALKSTGSAIVPEGTIVTWKAKTKTTSEVRIYAVDTLVLSEKEKDYFQGSKQLFKNYTYSLATSNADLQDYENLSYTIGVVKDAYPELNVKMQKDSIDQQSLYFYGQISDDYGLSRMQLVYYPTDREDEKTYVPIDIGATNFSEFVTAFPNTEQITEGQSYQLYFEVFDNDPLNNFKKTISSVFSYRKRTEQEEEQKQLLEQNKTINDINQTFDQLKEQDKKLEEFSKTQKEKERLNFNDKRRFEEFMKRQKQQEQLMKNFNKKLQDNLDEFQKEKNDRDVFKEDLKERLKENEAQLKKDEELLKELEEYRDKIDKEEFTQKLEELAKQNKNKQRSMQQLLELTKRFYVMKKAEKIAGELDELSKEQENLQKTPEENTSIAQDKLNKKFEEIQKSLDELKQEDRRLRKPVDVPRDEFLEDQIKFDQNEAKEKLEEKESVKEQQNQSQSKQLEDEAQKRQKQAVQKLKEMSKMMEQAAASGSGGGNQMAEDIDMLRQILENLLRYSFDQENLMDTFKRIEVDNNRYGSYIIEQNNLREHFEHVDDSLFALSLRQPKLSEKVNTQITNVYFNIDKALDLLTENRLYQGVAAQQYAVTASNELASFLSDVLDNMEMSMNPSPGQGQGMQLPDIIKSQKQIQQELEEEMKESNEGESGENGEEGKEEQRSEKGQEGGEEGQDGQSAKDGKEGKEVGKSSGAKEQDGNTGKAGKNGQGNNEGDSKTNDGYGEGGEEEQNARLFKIYQKQQQLRQALEDKLAKEGKIESAGELIKQMEEIEIDLLNYGFTNQTLQKMMELQHQLLKLEEATFLQGEDSKRESETNKKDYDQEGNTNLSNARKYFNTTEILNRQPLPLRQNYKEKLKTYFKSVNKQM
jgi:hypothetical protein